MPELNQSEFPALIGPYMDLFGATFSPALVPADRVDYLVGEMKKALAGERGGITDDELGTTIPDDAQS